MNAGVPPELAPFQASQRYFLIDQKRLDPVALAKEGTVLAALFRMGLSDVPDVLRELASVDELEEWTQRALDADSVEALFAPGRAQAANAPAPGGTAAS